MCRLVQTPQRVSQLSKSVAGEVGAILFDDLDGIMKHPVAWEGNADVGDRLAHDSQVKGSVVREE